MHPWQAQATQQGASWLATKSGGVFFDLRKKSRLIVASEILRTLHRLRELLVMGGGNGMKSKTKRDRNAAKAKNAGKGSQLSSNSKAMNIVCKICRTVSCFSEFSPVFFCCAVEAVSDSTIPAVVYVHHDGGFSASACRQQTPQEGAR